ncbi:unnamed protein product [Moneuplotes crassus]|uniref:RING-type domain-containing protein n=1 Tax=Euplotes crassus TaxID=5936 RepID=A0AAD2CX15_EUPCR|nr:unnamed protein product [Moneuplotes crassus]
MNSANYCVCPTCKFDYNTGLCLPKFLPCDHTACVGCLTRAFINDSEFECQMCGDLFRLPDPALLDVDNDTIKVIEAIHHAEGARKERSNYFTSPRENRIKGPHTEKPIRDFRIPFSDRTQTERDLTLESDNMMEVDGERQSSGSFHDKRKVIRERFEPRYEPTSGSFHRQRTEYHTTKKQSLFKENKEHWVREREFPIATSNKFKTPAPSRGFKAISPFSANPFKKAQEENKEEQGSPTIEKSAQCVRKGCTKERRRRDGAPTGSYISQYCSDKCKSMAESANTYTKPKPQSGNPFRT